MRKHLEANRKDKDGKFHLILVSLPSGDAGGQPGAAAAVEVHGAGCGGLVLPVGAAQGRLDSWCRAASARRRLPTQQRPCLTFVHPFLPAGGEPHPPPCSLLQEVQAAPTQLEVSGKKRAGRVVGNPHAKRERVSAPGALSRAIFVFGCFSTVSFFPPICLSSAGTSPPPPLPWCRVKRVERSRAAGH